LFSSIFNAVHLLLSAQLYKYSVALFERSPGFLGKWNELSLVVERVRLTAPSDALTADKHARNLNEGSQYNTRIVYNVE